MADIVIKITDQIGKELIDKLNLLQKGSGDAEKNLKNLRIAAAELKGAFQAVEQYASAQEKIATANDKIAISNSRVSKAMSDAEASYERAYSVLLRNEKAENSLSNAINKQIEAIEKRNRVLREQPTTRSDYSSLNSYLGGAGAGQASDPLKTNYTDKASTRGLIIESEALKLQKFRNEQEQIGLNAIKKGQDIRLESLNTDKLRFNNTQQITTETKKQLSSAVELLRVSKSAKGALGDSAIGAVGTGGIEAQTKALLKHNEALKESHSLYFRFGAILRTIAVAKFAIDSLKVADASTLMNNRLKLVSSSLENQKELYDQVTSLANKARVPIEELTTSFVRFDYALKPLGATQRESLRFTETFAKQLAISGLATQEQSSALLQMSQALNKGKLDGDEFRTIMETLPTVATAIAKTMGVARGELIKLAPEGKISATVIRDAMASIADDTDKAFNNTTLTVEQSFTVMNNSFKKFFGDINKTTGIFNGVANSISFLANNLNYLAAAGVGAGIALSVSFFPTIITGLKAIQTASLALYASPLFAPIIVGAVAAVAAVKLLNYAFNNLEQDAQTARDNAKADAFEAQRNAKAKALLYESEAIIKLRNEYKEYLRITEETNKGVNIGKIDKATQAVILQQSEIGKMLEKAKELTNFNPKKILTDNEKLEKEISDSNKLYDVAISDFKQLLLAKKELTDKAAKEFSNSTKAEEAARRASFGNEAKKAQAFRELDAFAINGEPKDDKGIVAYREGLKKLQDRIISLNSDIKKNEESIVNLNGATNVSLATFLKQIAADKELKSALQGLIDKRKELAESYRKSAFDELKAKTDKEFEKATGNKFDLEINNIKKTSEASIELYKKSASFKDASLVEIAAGILKTKSLELLAIKAVEDKREEASQREIDKVFLLGKEKQKAIEAEKKLQDEFNNKDISSLSELGQRRVAQIKANYEKEVATIQANISSGQKEKEKAELAGKAVGGINDVFANEKKISELQRGLNKTNEFSEIDNRVERQKQSALEIKELEKKAANDTITLEKEKTAKLLAIDDEYQARVKAIDKQAAKEKATIALQATSQALGSFTELAKGLASIAKKRDGEESKSAKRLFQISQALAVGQAITNLALSISEANKSDSYTKAAKIASAVAIGVSQVVAIRQNTLQGLATGGTVGGTGSTTSDSNLVRLSLGEEVIRESVARPNRAFLKDLNDGKVSTSNFNRTFNNSGGGSKPIINIYNTSADNNVTVEHSEVDGQDQFDIYVKKVEDKLAQNVSQGDGSLHSVIKGLTNRGF